MEHEFYVDDDGYIVHNKSRDTVARIDDTDYIEPLTRILDSHDDLLAAGKALLAFQDTDSIFRLPSNLSEISDLRQAIAKAEKR